MTLDNIYTSCLSNKQISTLLAKWEQAKKLFPIPKDSLFNLSTNKYWNQVINNQNFPSNISKIQRIKKKVPEDTNKEEDSRFQSICESFESKRRKISN